MYDFFECVLHRWCMVVWRSSKRWVMMLDLGDLHLYIIFQWILICFALIQFIWAASYGFSPGTHSKDMHVRLKGNSKLSVGVNESVDGCLSRCWQPCENWRLVQGEPHLQPKIVGTGLECGISSSRRWMDGWMTHMWLQTNFTLHYQS